jgi:hypothetical protein
MRLPDQGENTMARKILILVLLISISFSGITTVKADGPDTGYKWNNHAGKFNFKFGNLIDNHQQMRLLKNGALQGFIYIQFTGEYIDGIPVARRANCNDSALDCRVGWEVIGVPVMGAKLIQRGPRLWELDPASMPADPEFVHFHWMGTPKKACGLTVETEYNGYLFKRTAVTTFYWLGGNPDKEMGRLVTQGVDLHSNIHGIWSGGSGDGGEGDDHEEGGCSGHETGGDTGEGGHDSGGHETGG